MKTLLPPWPIHGESKGVVCSHSLSPIRGWVLDELGGRPDPSIPPSSTPYSYPCRHSEGRAAAASIQVQGSLNTKQEHRFVPRLNKREGKELTQVLRLCCHLS